MKMKFLKAYVRYLLKSIYNSALGKRSHALVGLLYFLFMGDKYYSLLYVAQEYFAASHEEQQQVEEILASSICKAWFG